MPIEKWSDKVSVVRLGDDPQFSEDMNALQTEAAGGRARNLVLDFAGVHFVSSSNIGQLLRLRHGLRTAGRRLVVCGVTTNVWSSLLAMGLDQLFDFSDDVTTALATIEGNL